MARVTQASEVQLFRNAILRTAECTSVVYYSFFAPGSPKRWHKPGYSRRSALSALSKVDHRISKVFLYKNDYLIG
jgi:hypothetical protein